MKPSGELAEAAESISDILRVQTARDPYIRSALDNRPALRKNRQLEGRAKKSQCKFVGSNLTQSAQPRLQFREINGPRRGMDLHRVPSAQAHRRACIPVEVDEIASAASRAVGIARRLVDLADHPRPHVNRGDARNYTIGPARQNLQR